jgi:hypothetical protein
MMAEMKAADSRLDALVKEMNAAGGEAKVNAVACGGRRTRSPAKIHARAHGPNASADDGWALNPGIVPGSRQESLDLN